MSVNYRVSLTTGDSTATYDISYLDQSSQATVATFVNGGAPTLNVPYSQLFNGVDIVVSNNAVNILIKSNGDCKNQTIIPITPQLPTPTPPNLCMSFIEERRQKNFAFTPNGTENGKTKWEYFDGTTTYKISWNPRVSNTGSGSGRWEMTYRVGLVFTTLNVSDIPDSGWYATGNNAAGILNLQVIQGSCPTVSRLDAELITTNTTCKNTTPCNGSIAVYPTGGSGIYSYSIDGINYQPSNIFNGLCENNYLVNVQDSLGSILQLNATIGYDGVPKVYTGAITINSNRVLVNTYNPQRKTLTVSNWELTFDNPIDVGTYINFTLSFTYTQLVNGPGEGQISGDTLVYLNNVLQTPSVNRTSTITTPRPNCGTANVTATTINQNYNITMTNADILIGTSISEMTITVPDSNASGCVTILGQTINAFASSNLQNPINGCQCCNVNFGKNNSSINIVREEIQI
jgi:hypothetical protein